MRIFHRWNSHRLLFLPQQQKQGQQRRQQLRCREGRPHAVHAKEGAHHQRADHNGRHAAADGGDRGFHRAVGGAQVARRHDVEPGKEVAHEVQPHAVVGKPGHLRRAFTVEPAHQRIGHAEHHRVQHGRQCQRGAAAQNEQLPGSGAVAVAVAAAHQRLGMSSCKKLLQKKILLLQKQKQQHLKLQLNLKKLLNNL